MNSEVPASYFEDYIQPEPIALDYSYIFFWSVYLTVRQASLKKPADQNNGEMKLMMLFM